MIREFKQSDMEQVLTIWLEASILAHDFIDKEFWESKVNDMRDIYIPSSETYVFCTDEAERVLQYENPLPGERVRSRAGEVVNGFISLVDYTVAALFVSPELQGKGIGTQLIDKAKSIRGILELCVYEKNMKSFEFYKKCDFFPAGVQVDERTGEAEILMRF